MKYSKVQGKICPDHVVLGVGEDEDDLQVESTVDVKDNWMSNFIFNSPTGILVHSICILSSFIYLIQRLLMNDDFIKLLMKNVYSTNLPTAYVAIGMEVLMHVVVLLILLPVSKYCKTTFTRSFLGIICSLIIFFIGFSDMDGNYLTEMGRTMVGIETVRLQLKLVSFLVECTKDDKLSRTSNTWSVLYFLFAPTLVYKFNYDRAENIRWCRVLCYIIWLFLLCTLYIGLFYEIFVPYLVINLTRASVSTIVINALVNAIFFLVFYIFVVTFMFFEVWCGLFAELLLFADHRFFGPYFKHSFDAQFVVDLNIVVSTWIRTYLFRPVLEASQSLYFAFIITFTLSMLYHEIIYSYALRQVLPLLLLWGPVLATYFYVIRINNCNRIVLLLLGLIGIFIYAYPHILEFSARKFSSEDGEKVSFRFIPLFVLCFINRINES